MSTNTLQTIFNGPKHAVVLATCVSDGTNNETNIVFDPTPTMGQGVNYSVVIAGQVYWPGAFVRLRKLSYDVQNMIIAMQWVATTSANILPLGAAPEDFDFTMWGGIKVPTGLAGATGQVQIVNQSPAVGASYSVMMEFSKGVPQS